MASVQEGEHQAKAEHSVKGGDRAGCVGRLRQLELTGQVPEGEDSTEK